MLATAGDTHLGGEDLDARLIEHLLSTWEKKHPGQPSLRDDKRAMQMVRREAERAKRVLSTAPSARVEIDGLGGGVEFSETVTRAKFEELCADLFKQTLVSCHARQAVSGWCGTRYGAAGAPLPYLAGARRARA